MKRGATHVTVARVLWTTGIGIRRTASSSLRQILQTTTRRTSTLNREPRRASETLVSFGRLNHRMVL